MFNAKKHRKSAQVSPYEKYLRDENVGPKADDQQPIWEKSIEKDYWTGDIDKITQKQIEPEHQIADEENSKEDAQIIEKVLNNANSYVVHRSDSAQISVPPISALVEKLRQNRDLDYTGDKKEHWSHTYNEKTQRGQLPKWPQIAKQHNKPVLNNDPQRFKNMEHLPTHWNQSENDAARGKSQTIKPLIGNITTADIDKVTLGVKTGRSLDYDTAVVAILREADKEQRELTEIEQKTVSDLKIARTKHLMKK